MRAATLEFFASAQSSRWYESLMYESFARLVYDDQSDQIFYLFKRGLPERIAGYKIPHYELKTLWQSLETNWDFKVFKLMLEIQRTPFTIHWDSIFYSILRSRDMEHMKYLLNDVRGFDVTKSLESHTAIFYAICTQPDGAPGVVKLLLEDGRIDPSYEHNWPIRMAARNGHAEVVKLLLADHRVNPADYHNDAIKAASHKGHIKIVKMLLNDHRVDPSEGRHAALQCAAAHNHIQVVKLLLKDPRVNPAHNDNFVLREAVSEGHMKLVRLLLKDPRVDPTTSIKIAVEKGQIDMAKLLLEDPRVTIDDKLIRDARKREFNEVARLLQEMRSHRCH